jgi:hypothetical protein
MRRNILFGCIATALLSVPVSAQAPTSVSEDARERTRGVNPDAMTCRRIRLAGSRLRRHQVCMTNREWQRYRDTGNQTARDLLDRNTLLPGIGG